MSCNYNNITTITEKTIKGSQIVSLPQEVPSADKNHSAFYTYVSETSSSKWGQIEAK